MKSDTVAILYHPGTYGTYLHWALHSLTSTESLINPIRQHGNSHNFVGSWLMTIENYRHFAKNPKPHSIVRLHPKTEKHHDLLANIAEVCDNSHQVVYVIPDQDTLLLCLHNFATKIWQDWWHEIVILTDQKDKIYQQWSIDPKTPLADVPRWIQREFLSYFMMPMWMDQIGWNDSQKLTISNCKIISVSSLLHDFKAVMEDIERWTGLRFLKPIDQLIPLHEEMLRSQPFLSVDSECKKILSAVLENRQLDWQPLHLVGESWIQWALRLQGYEIECHGLDMFPTNSICLKDIIYKP